MGIKNQMGTVSVENLVLEQEMAIGRFDLTLINMVEKRKQLKKNTEHLILTIAGVQF